MSWCNGFFTCWVDEGDIMALQQRFASVPILLVLLVFSSCVHGAETTTFLKTPPKEMAFGGLHWRTKSSLTPISPGPNYWSAKDESIWVDDVGLHLSVQEMEGHWFSTEIFTRERVGYGTYTFTVNTDVLSYDPNLVAGFFTWDTSPEEANREIDIEFAAWGEKDGTKFQYVVQPYSDPSRILIFDPKLQGSVTTHRIIWLPDSLSFSSYHGSVDPDEASAESMLMQSWIFSGKPPTPGRARFRINLWMFQGAIPKQPAHMVITAFSFVPMKP